MDNAYVILKNMIDTKNAIWGDEAHHCQIVQDTVNVAIRGEARVFAECDLTGDRRMLTENNFADVLNDMFYDYCVEDAAWMGV